MALKIFFCYAHEDELYLNKLKAFLRSLQRQALIDVWHDRDISAGTEWEQEISKHLNEAKIILLLVSPDFMNSDYCYSVEMKRALERHECQEAMVIPVIVRPIYWQGVLGNIQALPTDAKPLVDRYWHTLDEALYDVAEGIRTVVVQLGTPPVPPPALKRESADASLTILSPQPAKPLLSFKPEALSLLHTLKKYTDTVTSVAFSPDGQSLASASADGTIKLWNVATGLVVRTLTGRLVPTFRRFTVYSVAFSSDGHTLAGSWGQTIKLWNVATGKQVCTLTGHTEHVFSVAFSPDGHTLASGSHDQTIKLWNVATDKEVHVLTGHTSSVHSVAFSPDGHTLASGSHDQTIKLWNVTTGKDVCTLIGHTSSVHSVAFSPDGHTLASGSWDQTIKLWNVTTGKQERTLSRHTNYVTSVAFSPDGRTLASGSFGNTIKIWGKEEMNRW